MQITKEKIEKLNTIVEEVDALTEEVSEAIKNAKLFKNEEAFMERDGKQIMIKQALMWEEVRVLGKQTSAYDALKGLYPEVFELSEKQKEKADEYMVFCRTELGVDPTALKLRDVLNIVGAMIDYKNGNNGDNKTKESTVQST